MLPRIICKKISYINFISVKTSSHVSAINDSPRYLYVHPSFEYKCP